MTPRRIAGAWNPRMLKAVDPLDHLTTEVNNEKVALRQYQRSPDDVVRSSTAAALPADGIKAVHTTHAVKLARDTDDHDYGHRWWWWRNHHRRDRWDDDDHGRHWWWRHSREQRGQRHREQDHDSDRR